MSAALLGGFLSTVSPGKSRSELFSNRTRQSKVEPSKNGGTTWALLITLSHPGSSVGGRGLQLLWTWPLTPEIAASRPHASVPETYLDPVPHDRQLQLVCAE